MKNPYTNYTDDALLTELEDAEDSMRRLDVQLAKSDKQSEHYKAIDKAMDYVYKQYDWLIKELVRRRL